MNDLQKVVFDLFLCFDEICKSNNIKYFLVSGSALGAVRHKGFIPWDDDLDVGMYREDYDKFLQTAPDLLSDGVFLQNYRTDPRFPLAFSKLRKSDTAFIEGPLAHLDMNHGIYMDIFPLDGYPQDLAEQKRLRKKKRSFRRKLYCGFNMPRDMKAGSLAAVLRFFGYHKRTAETLREYEAVISSYKAENSEIVCSHGNRHGERDYIPKEYYGKGTEVSFEGIKVIVPEKYDEYLTCLYGDWRVLPPTDQQKSVHNCVVCDTRRPYTDYMKKK